MKAPDRVEQIFEFRVRHLLTVRRDVHEEAPAEGVGLALLRRHDHVQNSVHALDFQLDWRLSRARGALQPRLQPVVIRHADDLTGVGDADQNGPAVGVGERTQLSANVLGK